jgi:succinylglutamate desuccinylase
MEGRIIDRFEGSMPGPLLICIGGMHGNEPAGPAAIFEVFRLLDIETKCSPDFQYKGVVVGIRGNLEAIRLNQRYIHRDLNRMMLEEELERILQTPGEWRSSEDKEFLDLIDTIRGEQFKYNPSLTLILDLHTTTADGGIFTIAAEDEMSRALAKGLHAPVILGFAEDLKGTTLNFLNRPDVQTYCIVFESGQHQDPESVHRSAAAIVKCMRTLGAVDSKDVDHRHDGILQKMAEGLPKVTNLIYHYRIKPGEQFTMKPGYKNFQTVKAGEVVAENENGDVTAPLHGLILMPKYQLKGEDGFFLVEVIE